MQVDGKQTRPIWINEETNTVTVIDQRRLPHEFLTVDLKTVDDVIFAIKEMVVRGAPLIGVTAAYGVFIAAVNAHADGDLIQACNRLKSARPTAINLSWAIDRVLSGVLKTVDAGQKIDTARRLAENIAEAEVENCKKIGEHGLPLIESALRNKAGNAINILTHCNAGWLACIEYGTATAPIYAAFEKGIDVHVWVDETRPLNQGARLTAWELGKHGVKHTVITDNAGGHLMQQGMVDMIIVGTDRTTRTGDVANKIGTYLKALAARDNNLPFYVALPSSTFDWNVADGIKEIPIEERDPDEIRYVAGRDENTARRVLITPENSPVANFAFDVTPARLITGLITERGVCKAAEEDILQLFPEFKFKTS